MTDTTVLSLAEWGKRKMTSSRQHLFRIKRRIYMSWVEFPSICMLSHTILGDDKSHYVTICFGYLRKQAPPFTAQLRTFKQSWLDDSIILHGNGIKKLIGWDIARYPVDDFIGTPSPMRQICSIWKSAWGRFRLQSATKKEVKLLHIFCLVSNIPDTWRKMFISKNFHFYSHFRSDTHWNMPSSHLGFVT